MSVTVAVVLFMAVTPGPAPPASGATVTSFRTQAEPRVDPVFADAITLRAIVDHFLSLQMEMEAVRNQFSGAVHDTLAVLPSAQPPVGLSKAAKMCPPAVAASYARAWQAGVRYLQLGQQLETSFRDVRRGDDQGDTQGLTPDYRIKAKHTRELYTDLLRDLREMRVAFYDQLGAELRFAGCPFGAIAAPVRPGTNPASAAADPVDPTSTASWDIGWRDDEESTGTLPRATTNPEDAAPGDGAAAVWIDVDNTPCAQPSRISVDGVELGEIAAVHRTAVRTRAGPREICLLPASDKRSCGMPGTLRKTYVYDGLTLTVHCTK